MRTSTWRYLMTIVLAALFVGAGAQMVGCEEGPAENAGEEIDEAAEDAGEAIDDAVDDLDDGGI
ncbi:MAG: hypothetical protein IT430_19290 [Phycisphaerales bacterium]|nr:hypothetical protein [Phycisphaerales bacterium]